MKRFGCLLLVIVASQTSAQTVEDVRRALKQRGEVDELRWKDPSRGPAFQAGIVRATATGLEVQRHLPSGTIKRELPYDQIDSVRFHLSMGERQLLAEARPEHAPLLRVFWEARGRSLALPGSNAGDFGLALARALRHTGTASALNEAHRIATVIAEQDHDPQRQKHAKTELATLAFLQLQQTAKPEVVEKRAWAITEEVSDAQPDLMLLATSYLMQREFAALRKLETEHPRWMDDAEVEPQRQRHYHLALDLALYPSLFHPLRTTEAAAGLWQAAQVHLHNRDTGLAVATLEDLLALYPDSAPATQAKSILPPLKTSLQEAPASTESAPKAETSPKETAPAPSPPKRYNLFED